MRRHLLVPLQEKHMEQVSRPLSTAHSAASLRPLITSKLVTLGYHTLGILNLGQWLYGEDVLSSAPG